MPNKSYQPITDSLLDKLSSFTTGFLFIYVDKSDGFQYFEFLGPQFETIYGASREAALKSAKEAWVRVHPDDVVPFQEALSPCARSSIELEFEFRVVNTAGVITNLQLKGKSQPDNLNGFRLYGYCNNVNQFKAKNDELLQTQEALEQALATHTRLLATVSHELRTPVAAAMSSLELAKTEHSRVAQATWLDQSIRQLSNHLQTLEQIMDITAVVTHDQQLQLEWTNIDGLLRQVIEPMRNQLRSKQLRLHLKDQVPTDNTLKLARLPTSRIISHLLDNAIKFTQSGCIEVHAHLAQSNPNQRGELCVTVTDTGIGLRSEDIERILEPLYQADSDFNRWTGGTGLGLTLVKTLIDALNGTLSITSKLGEGTQVSCRIPVEISTKKAVGDAAPASNKNASDNSTVDNGRPRINPAELLNDARILVAEDNELNRAIMGAILTRFGCNISYAFNGEEAVLMADNLRPDVIIMDLQMPILDGFEATKQIRTTQANVPIIAWSASRFPEQQQMVQDAGMDDYLTKPTKDADLKAYLIRHLEKAKQGT